VLFDLAKGNLQSMVPGSSEEMKSRKRPESSSPEKLKARNKAKYHE